jgi:hypothetical protein
MKLRIKMKLPRKRGYVKFRSVTKEHIYFSFETKGYLRIRPETNYLSFITVFFSIPDIRNQDTTSN